MRQSLVVGLFYGDEGKGTVVNALTTGPNTCVIRFSGGAQAGHTVVNNGIRHVFSHFGAGTLKGAPTYWSKLCPVNPMNFIRERTTLVSKGIIPKIYIDPDAPVTIPGDVWINDRSGDTAVPSTCGVGVGATHEREKEGFTLNFFEIMNMPAWMLRAKVETFHARYHNQTFNIQPWLDAVEQMKSCVLEHNPLASNNTENVIFEGSQGLLLDKNYGIFPYVTNSNTVPSKIFAINGIGSLRKTEIYGVQRAYLTKHGNGPHNLQPLKQPLINNIDETNIYNRHQGSFHTGRHDLELLKYSVKLLKKSIPSYLPNQIKIISTCEDQLQDQDLADYKANMAEFGDYTPITEL